MKEVLGWVLGWMAILAIFFVIFVFIDNTIGHYILGGIVLAFVAGGEVQDRIAQKKTT